MVSDHLLQRLEAVMLSRDPVDVHINRLRSSRPCALSASCDREMLIGSGKALVHLGASVMWIPARNEAGYWAAPSMVFHYLRDHSYLPPEQFLLAVEAMDLTRRFKAQEVYLKQIVGHF